MAFVFARSRNCAVFTACTRPSSAVSTKWRQKWAARLGIISCSFWSVGWTTSFTGSVFAVSRRQARQLVCHGHFEVNGKKIDIPSYLVKAGDTLSVREGSRDIAYVKENAEVAGSRSIPAWLEVSGENLSAKVIALPNRDQIESPVNEQLVVEFYAR